MLDLQDSITMGGETALEKRPSAFRNIEELCHSQYVSRRPNTKEIPMNLISREELKEKLDNKEDFKLVFVMSDWHYRVKHIPGSLNLYKPEEALKALNQEDEIVVYCSNEACRASSFAYDFLVGHGFKNVRRYAGGLWDWETAGYPLAGEGLK